jgi:predicted aspartyl protease
LPIGALGATTWTEIDAQIDTGFSGALLLPTPIVAQLGLSLSSKALIAWFSEAVRLQALAGGGAIALIGMRLIQDC